jgi:succinate dehydrogenase / fumarate reductase iron-sulfur subunit
MRLEVTIKRFDPDKDTAPYWATYELDAERDDRVLDALHFIKWYQDGTLAFRRSCAHGVCGSDAMVINGVNRLACKLLVGDVGPRISVEPIRGLPVVKDLIVDMEPFFDGYRKMLPFLINDEPTTDRERLQSAEDRDRMEEGTKCILCAACTTSCPIFWSNESYVGPAAIVNAHRFLFDSRDRATGLRLETLNGADGVWRCRTAFNCTDACPRDIPVTQLIEEVKRALLFRRT